MRGERLLFLLQNLQIEQSSVPDFIITVHQAPGGGGEGRERGKEEEGGRKGKEEGEGEGRDKDAWRNCMNSLGHGEYEERDNRPV